MKTCYIYTRTASRQQCEHASSAIILQQKLCSTYAQKHGYKILRIFNDDGVSGNTLKRKGLRDLIVECDIKVVDAIIVLHANRIARNLADLMKICRLFGKKEIKLFSVQDGDLSKNTLTFNIFASLVQLESERRELK